MDKYIIYLFSKNDLKKMLIYKRKLSNIFIGIWKIDEDLEILKSFLTKQNVDLVTDCVKNKTKIKEKLAVRALLKEMLQKEVFLKSFENGKPYLDDNSYQISVSHTIGYAALALFQNQKIGVDIEHISDRVLRIESKFINEQEFIDSDNKIKHLLIHWSAKESIYKAVSSENINLKNDIVIERFKPSDRGILKARCRLDSFNVKYKFSDQYVFTIAISQN